MGTAALRALKPRSIDALAVPIQQKPTVPLLETVPPIPESFAAGHQNYTVMRMPADNDYGATTAYINTRRRQLVLVGFSDLKYSDRVAAQELIETFQFKSKPWRERTDEENLRYELLSLQGMIW